MRPIYQNRLVNDINLPLPLLDAYSAINDQEVGTLIPTAKPI
nr:hypothetical protein [Saccharolobus caldissimus]